MTNYKVMGMPTARVDGRSKVTGSAKYAADHNRIGLAHGWVVSSAIAKGRIIAIQTRDALALDGVLTVLTHENRPRVAKQPEKYRDNSAPEGGPFRPLSSDRIWFAGQPIALLVAEDLETARFAAT